MKLEREADCDEVGCCNIVTGNLTLTIGLFYRSRNITEEHNNIIIQHAIKEVSKGNVYYWEILTTIEYNGNL